MYPRMWNCVGDCVLGEYWKNTAEGVMCFFMSSCQKMLLEISAFLPHLKLISECQSCVSTDPHMREKSYHVETEPQNRNIYSISTCENREHLTSRR